MWFGVKAAYQTGTVGRPRGRDDAYVAGVSSLEYRITLVRARDAEAALTQASEAARAYASLCEHRNVYRQTVKTTLIGLELYEMEDKPADGVEVYSNTIVTDRKVTRSRILEGLREQKFSGLRQRAFRTLMAENVVRELDSEFGEGWDRDA